MNFWTYVAVVEETISSDLRKICANRISFSKGLKWCWIKTKNSYGRRDYESLDEKSLS